MVALLFLFVLIPAGAAAVAHAFADDAQESGLFWRLLGHGVLGIVTLHITRLQLPVGYPLALVLAGRADVNVRARRIASTCTFAVWLIGQLTFLF